METEDTYLRLDKDIEDFIAFLDSWVGKGNYLLFLTADHGAMNNAGYLQYHRIPAGNWDADSVAVSLNKLLHAEYPEERNLVKCVMNYQVFFDRDIIEKHNLDFKRIKESVTLRLQKDPRVLYACDMSQVSAASIPEAVKQRIPLLIKLRW